MPDKIVHSRNQQKKVVYKVYYKSSSATWTFKWHWAELDSLAPRNLRRLRLIEGNIWRADRILAGQQCRRKGRSNCCLSERSDECTILFSNFLKFYKIQYNSHGFLLGQGLRQITLEQQGLSSSWGLSAKQRQIGSSRLIQRSVIVFWFAKK